ncbi:hypothetical protein D9M68_605130 [compost metagenome]
MPVAQGLGLGCALKRRVILKVRADHAQWLRAGFDGDFQRHARHRRHLRVCRPRQCVAEYLAYRQPRGDQVTELPVRAVAVAPVHA